MQRWKIIYLDLTQEYIWIKKEYLIWFQDEYLDDNIEYDNVIVEELIQQPHNINRAAGRRTINLQDNLLLNNILLNKYNRFKMFLFINRIPI